MQGKGAVGLRPWRQTTGWGEAAFAIPHAADFNAVTLPWFFFRFQFTLATPYLSKEDGAGDHDQTPIARDWVFGLPMVRPSSWKGALRFAAGECGATPKRLCYLFGNERSDELEHDDMSQGRLRFFPTFFPATHPEPKLIFSPHSRVKRTNTTLANVGMVRQETTGAFALLYAGRAGDKGDNRAGTAAEVAGWVAAMLVRFGIGAKTLKGNGLCKSDITGVECWPNHIDAAGLRLAGATTLWNLDHVLRGALAP